MILLLILFRSVSVRPSVLNFLIKSLTDFFWGQVNAIFFKFLSIAFNTSTAPCGLCNVLLDFKLESTLLIAFVPISSNCCTTLSKLSVDFTLFAKNLVSDSVSFGVDLVGMFKNALPAFFSGCSAAFLVACCPAVI